MTVTEVLLEARRLLLARRFDESEALCRRLLKAQSVNVDAIHMIALCRHEQGDFAAALKSFEAVLKLDNHSAWIRLSHGNSLRAVGRLAEATASYSKAAALDPRLPEAHHNLALALSDAGRFEAALPSHARAVELRPAYIDGWLGLANTLLAMDRLDEAAQGYRRILELQPDHADASSNLGAALQGLRRPEEALSHFDRALRLRPNHDIALANRALVLLELGRLVEALAATERMLGLDPARAAAWHQRGRILSRLRRREEAIECLRRAAQLEPDSGAIQVDLALELAWLDRADDVLAVLERYLRERSGDAAAWTNRGLTLSLLARFDQARASYERALAIEPDRPDARFHLAFLDLRRGDLARGWPGYEARWDVASTKLRRRNFAAPLWTGEQPLSGRTLFVHAEQGLGDTLHFCRYLNELATRAAHVVFEVQAHLVGLLRRNLPPQVAIISQGTPLPRFDLHVPLLSIPLACATTLETVPAPCAYLQADGERVVAWQGRLGESPGLRVGLAWSGNPAHGNDGQRSIALGELAPLLSGRIQFIALQTDVRDTDLEALSMMPSVLYFGDAIADFDDTAALIALCDVVVAVDTSVVHLAGAMGRPVWVLVPRVPDWRWMLDRDDSPWYPSARLFRQPVGCDWESVIQRVTDELGAMLPRAALAQAREPVAQD